MKIIRKRIIQWFLRIVILIFLLRLFILEFYHIPSTSMKNTLLIGDVIVSSKIHYGTRLPVNLKEIPYMSNLSYYTGTYRFLEFISWSETILPGFSGVKTNDVILFKHPDKAHKIYIKRCVGISGDTIKIKNSLLQSEMIDSVIQQNYCYNYSAEMSNELKEEIDEKYPSINFSYHTLDKAWSIQMNNAQFDSLKDKFQKITKNQEIGYNRHIFPYSKDLKWNRDNFGPIIVPQKGMTIELNEGNLLLYQNIIDKFENVQDIENFTQYTFKKNYFFVLGDNRQSSSDSRYWGFVPEEYIVGKAVLIIWSYDDYNKNIRWNRFLKIIS